jgi:hypothetical protein
MTIRQSRFSKEEFDRRGNEIYEVCEETICHDIEQLRQTYCSKPPSF